MGRHFLHEQCISDERIHLVQGPMCRWRMTATDDRHGQGFVCGQTRWATSSSRHAGENRRVRVDWAERDRCTHRDFVKEELKAFGKQLVDDGRLDSVSLYAAGPTADFLELDAQEWQDDEYDQQENLLDPLKVKEGKREEHRLSVEAKSHLQLSRKRMRGTTRPTFLTEVGSEKQGRKGQSTTGCERDQESQI